MQIKNRQQLLIIITVVAVALFAGDQLVLGPLLKVWNGRATRIANLHKDITEANIMMQREQLPGQSIRGRWQQMTNYSLPN
ncbi:MAG: hypothetical protein NT154_04760, partial [Verrucomicrobia bacterium]|nr:hypothetical protein [Verrucomicrobiota bacterium]